MKIAVNAVLSYEQPRGVGRYLNTILKEISNLDTENEYYIYYGDWMEAYDFVKIHRPNFHLIPLHIKNTQVSRNLYLALVLPFICKKNRMDVFWLIDTQAILVKPSGMKYVSTIHDLAEYVVPEKYSKKQGFLRRNIVRIQAKLSDQIITISNYSKNDICSRFNIDESKVHVIYHGNGFMADDSADKSTYVTKSYFLFVGEIERAKNLECLVDAFAMLDDSVKDRFYIEVVGKPGNCYEYIKEKISTLGLGDKINFNGYLSDEDLNRLYAEAYAFVFPSLFEGFGLPVMEAMSKGLPVIISDSSSLPEVGGDAALYFSPKDKNELCEQLSKIISVRGLRDEMVRKSLSQAETFSLGKMGGETLAVMELLGIN